MSQKSKNEQRIAARQEAIRKKFQPHSLKVEGISALERHKVLLEEELAVGDAIDIFMLPDGRHFLTKTNTPNSDSLVVDKITTSYIYFEEELEVREV